MTIHIPLEKLEIYILARELSKISWQIYSRLPWQMKKIIGDQFIESTDSVGANIAEGYGRFHYLDRIKFYYNARASLSESKHWYELLTERGLIIDSGDYLSKHTILSPKLNSFINSNYRLKRSS